MEATSFHPYGFPNSEAALQRASRYSVQLGSKAPWLQREQLVLLAWESAALPPCCASLLPEHDLLPRQKITPLAHYRLSPDCSIPISLLQITKQSQVLCFFQSLLTTETPCWLAWFCGPFFQPRILGHFSKVKENRAMTLGLSHFQAEWQRASSQNFSEKPIDSCLSQVPVSL